VIYVFYVIHVMVSLFLILVVLLQQGKGADLSVFGGGSTQAAFGARGAATLLHKLTVFGFVAFIITTVGIGFLQTGGSTKSVMESVEQPADAEAAPEPVVGDSPFDLGPETTETEPVADEAPAEGEATASGDGTEPPPESE